MTPAVFDVLKSAMTDGANVAVLTAGGAWMEGKVASFWGDTDATRAVRIVDDANDNLATIDGVAIVAVRRFGL